MVAAVADPPVKTAVVWHELRCKVPTCRTLLFRYRTPLVPSDPGRVLVIEWVCPDRRCRKCQTVILPESVL